MNTVSLRFPLIRKLVLSPYLDLFGAVLILGVCLVRSFHTTIYYEGAIQFNIPVNELLEFVIKGAYPLGIMSTAGAVFSLLSTRLIGKQNNIGNGIGIATTINSGANDFLFGNLSAAITYPLTFIINSYCTYNWTTGIKLRYRDKFYLLIFGVGLLVGYLLVYLGFKIFGGFEHNIFFHTVSITFGLSLGANMATAFKYQDTWLSWFIYNLVQLVKNTIQMNLANVVKYIFYLFNAAVTLLDWKSNGDR